MNNGDLKEIALNARFDIGVTVYQMRAKNIEPGMKIIHRGQEQIIVNTTLIANMPDRFQVRMRSEDWSITLTSFNGEDILDIVPMWPVAVVLITNNEEQRQEGWDLLLELTEAKFSSTGNTFYASLSEGQYLKALNSKVFTGIFPIQ